MHHFHHRRTLSHHQNERHKTPAVISGDFDGALDPQHASRFDVVTLPPWELNPEFQQLVASFERVLPLKKPSLLHQSETVSLLFAISEGNLGNLHRLLVECAVEAIKTGTEKIDKSIIEGKQWLRPTHGIRELV
ncbi:TniB family NTP-binding protein [Acidithiobacillus ferrooxidans]|uniref:TniB family NTP-binding protein n=1 Tax=Acidithiobacillus ferrooxidans TaxID=920 RepID=UPI001E3DB3AF|nr:TniB family NTP-binding protein [Acidithiobacillus ferrooxidans]